MAHTSSRGKLLDVGCATGFFLDEARQAGWDVRGCEVSEWAATYAREHFRLNVVMAPFPTPLLGPEQYDAVTFLNVFEQLPDPHAAERVLRDLVKPGGLLALETWDVDARCADVGHKWRTGQTNADLPQPAVADRSSGRRSGRWWSTAPGPSGSLAHGLHRLGLAAHPSKNGEQPRHAGPDRAVV
jgi:SAM-dependent methyltransferase